MTTIDAKNKTTTELAIWLEGLSTGDTVYYTEYPNFDEAAKRLRAQEARIAALSKDAERLKFFNQVWRWKALKDGEIIYQYGEHVPSLFQKTAELLPTHQPAPKAITASNVDADIEYWRQKYLKLDAMYDELEKEKIAIEQNLMDRT